MTEHLPNSKISRTTPETQDKSLWVPPSGTLGALVADAWKRAEKLGEVREVSAFALSRSDGPSLRAALRRQDVAVIAEIKRSSPSKGTINPSMDAVAQAKAYERGGAAAVSVLTETTRFGGTASDLADVSRAVSIPTLKKDFHVAPMQLTEALSLNASAALVIVRAIEPSRLEELAQASREIGLEVVYEVRDERELERAIGVGAEIIGVNNRNLETLEIDATTVPRILPAIPADCIAIAESGYRSRRDVESAADAGADAVLIGSMLSSALDVENAVRELTGVRRRSRD
jgi:indole-3-glycerol phosphate synthase